MEGDSLGKSLKTIGLEEVPPGFGLGGGLGVFDAFPVGGSFSGGSRGGKVRVISAWGAVTRGACSMALTMPAAFNVSRLSWEEKSALRLSGGVISPCMSRSGPSLPWG